ncbi:MAG: hypothetical protein H6647_19955 [Anaerolineales bacterium]|nr:hypothetical protein [Anaerolineales bacterium]
MELPGLDTAGALEFAGTVLQELSLPQPPRESLSRFMDFLGGHPLHPAGAAGPARPARRGPADRRVRCAAARLHRGRGQGAQPVAGGQPALLAAPAGEEAQAVLPRLAVFRAGHREPLLAITEIDPATWASLKPALANAALVRLEEIPASACLRPLPPTWLPSWRDLPADQRAALKRYWQAYYQFAGYLYQNDSKAPHQARASPARAANLKAGLRLALAAGAGRGGGLRRQHQPLPGLLRALAGAG